MVIPDEEVAVGAGAARQRTGVVPPVPVGLPRRPEPLRAGFATAIGYVRRRNEDAWWAHVDAGVVAVFDGLGGHPAGDLASFTAVGTVAQMLGATGTTVSDAVFAGGSAASQDGAGTLDHLAAAQDGDTAVLATTGGTDGSKDGRPPAPATADDATVEAALVATLRAAHRAVLGAATGRSDRTGMGTTAVLAHVAEDGRVRLAPVGDSRAYLLRDGRMLPITVDHARQGYITQALGLGADVVPDATSLPLARGETLLLCTDGLFGMLPDDRLAEVADDAGPDPQDVADALVAAALAAGGHDNVTVVVVAGDAPAAEQAVY